MDDDQDGVISSENICISTISNQVLQFIAPLLFQMDAEGLQISSEMFRAGFDKLLVSKDQEETKELIMNYAYKGKEFIRKGKIEGTAQKNEPERKKTKGVSFEMNRPKN